MKYEKLKRKFLIESGIVAAIAVAVGGIIFTLEAICDDYTEGNQAAQKKVDVIDLEHNTLKTKYTNITQNADLFNDMQKKRSAGQLGINRQMVLEKFNQYKTEYDISNLRLSVSPAQDLKDAAFRRKSSSVNFSEVNVGMELTTDENAFTLLDTLQQELPGVSKVTRISLSRTKPLDETALKTIARKGSYPMIKADIKFLWFGINVLETQQPGVNAVKPQP